MINYLKIFVGRRLFRSREYLAAAFQNIRSHKIRNIFTMSGIALGAAAAVFLSGLNLSFSEHTLGQLRMLGGNLVAVNFSDNSLMTRPVFENCLKSLGPLIESVNWFSETAYDLPVPGQKKIMVTVRAVKDDYSQMNLNECRVSQKLIDETDGLYNSGRSILINNRPLTIVGVMGASGEDFFNQRPIIFISERVVRLLPLNFTPGAFIKIRSLADGRILEKLLRKTFPDENQVVITSFSSAGETVSRFSRLSGRIIFFITLLTVLVGGLGIANVMLINITEKTYEFGILLATGILPEMIFTEVLLESLVLAVGGGFLGAGVGLFLDLVLTTLFLKIIFIFPLAALVAVLAASALFGFIFGFYPAGRASRMEPVEAVRGG